MGVLNLTSVLSALCVVYLAHTGWQFYQMFTPVLCEPGSDNCLLPEIEPSADGSFPAMQLRVYTSIQKESGHAMRHYHLVHSRDGMSIAESTTDQVNITLPSTTLKNGTLYAHVFLMPAGYEGKDPNNAAWLVQQSSIITAYQHPVADTFQLMSDEKEEKKPVKIGKPVAHLRSVLPITISSDAPHFDIQHLSGEIAGLLHNRQHGRGYKYYPIMLIDQLGFRTVDLKEIKPAESTMSLSISYRPSSVGKMRMLVQMSLALENLKKMGFTDKDTDEVKGLFSDTNVYLLAVTVCVSTLHILFDVLSFKNDISFWKSRKTMVGLSTRTLLWRAFSSTIIFLYLADKNTSLLVLIPSGIGCLIEYWKCTRALKVSVSLSGISFGASTSAEQETEQHDSQAMRWLAWLMVPLCVGGAVYSLLYVPHKSWYSWVMECLANGVYAFGFLFMLPQLFVNYKLKSVAHLPWRAFMYKAFNTFIDDLFAFIITMPTAHRLACFRDDVVFVVYLWQRYLYPVDHTRINEFGEGGEEGESAHKEEGADKADKKND